MRGGLDGRKTGPRRWLVCILRILRGRRPQKPAGKHEGCKGCKGICHPASSKRRRHCPATADRSADIHALNEDGMVLCNPRDKEAAHRVQMGEIATGDRTSVTCRKCRELLYKLEQEGGK